MFIKIIKITLNKIFSEKIYENSLSDILKKSEGIDSCITPVLDLNETIRNHHNIERNTFINIDGIDQPGPAPRFDNKQLSNPSPPVKPGENTKDILKNLGYTENDIVIFKNKGSINY